MPKKSDANSKPKSKVDTLISLMKGPNGADAQELAAATKWQVHSVRGAIAGTLKKRLGLKVSTEKVDGRTVYRVEG